MPMAGSLSKVIEWALAGGGIPGGEEGREEGWRLSMNVLRGKTEQANFTQSHLVKILGKTNLIGAGRERW
jgi:hypothetical protein